MDSRTDAALVAAWIATRDETAFAAMASRHGPMVHRACRALLGDHHQAEEAAQAVFVILARKARDCRHRENLGGWLFGIARRVASHAVRDRIRRERAEKEAAMRRQNNADAGTGVPDDRLPRVYAALGALSENQRRAIVLRYLENRSADEAARLAGCPPNAFSCRLSDAVAKLRKRLAGAGIALSAGVLVALLESESQAAVPMTLIPSLISASTLTAAGVAGGAAATAGAPHAVPLHLAEGVMKIMFWAKVKFAAMVVAGAITMGVGIPAVYHAVAGDAVSAATGPLGFASAPSAKASGDTVTIRFSVKAPCDAAVWVEDGAGKVVRHIAAGVLGDNPPDLFKKGLVQELEWDGRDDAGKPVLSGVEGPAPGGCKVKVGLGLTHKFDRIIGWDAKAIRKIYSVAVGPKGEVFVLSEMPYDAMNPMIVTAWSREGKYLRTLIPYPANLTDEQVAGVKTMKLADGRRVPLVYSAMTSTQMPFMNGIERQTMAVAPSGKLVMVSGCKTYWGGTRMPRAPMGWGVGPRRLLIINTDGSLPQPFGGPVLKEGATLTGNVHLALSPDGKTVYASGLNFGGPWAKKEDGHSCYAVFSVPLEGLGPAKVFAGEWNMPGNDEKHFGEPAGIATDKEGNVHIADYANNRIIKLDGSGKFLGKIDIEAPDAIAINGKTGAIYVVSVKTTYNDRDRHHPFQWQNKKLLKLKSWAEPKVAGTLTLGQRPDGNHWTIAVDDGADPTLLWIGSGHYSPYHGSGNGLWRVEDKGDSFGQPVAVTGPESGSKGIYSAVYVAVDPASELVQVVSRQERDWQCFDGRTGLPAKSPLPLSGKDRGAEREHGPDGTVYIRDFGKILRFGADGKPKPFPGTGTNEVPVSGGIHGNDCPRGMDVASNGDLYALHFASERGDPVVSVFGPDGKLKLSGAVKAGLPGAQSLRVDRAGNIYLAANVKPVGELVPAELAGKVVETSFLKPVEEPGLWENWYPWIYGSVIKFPPTGGTISKGAGAGKPYKEGYGGDVSVEGALWLRTGASMVPTAPDYCACLGLRFDLDGFDRLYVPDVGRCCVQVLDSAGNPLGRFGAYGNADSAGPGSRIPEPEIAFAWPGCLDVVKSTGAVYVVDWLNLRVVKVVPTYATTAECPAP
ncbi:MAG: sigma-70 family RNA polymerase sigma factor [Planctomycetota bacterium]